LGAPALQGTAGTVCRSLCAAWRRSATRVTGDFSVALEQAVPGIGTEAAGARGSDLGERTVQPTEVALPPGAGPGHDAAAVEIQQEDPVLCIDLQVVCGQVRVENVGRMEAADACADTAPQRRRQRPG